MDGPSDYLWIAEDGMMAKAIDICAQKSSEGLEGKVSEVKATSEASIAVISDSSLMNTATKLLGN